MLSQVDLTQIGKIVRDEVRGEINPIKKDVASLKQDVRVLKQDVSGLKQGVGELKRDMKGVKSDIREIKNDLKTTINFFDHEYLDLRKRVIGLEEQESVGALS